MTREEAIQVLTDIKRIRSDEIAKAVDMAISALSADVCSCYTCEHWNSETKGCKRNPSVEEWSENDYCSYYFGKPLSAKQVTSKLKNPYNSLLTEESEDSKEQKSKLEPSDDFVDALESCDRPSGEWQARRTSLEFVCSNCGEACWRDFNYCPSCGARMENTK